MRSMPPHGKYSFGLPTKALSLTSGISKNTIAPVGEVLVLGTTVNASHTQQVTVPEGVYEICAVCLSGGDSGNATGKASGVEIGSGMGGIGGNLRWKNRIPVMPGWVLNLSAGGGGDAGTETADGSGNVNAISSVVGVASYISRVGGIGYLLHTDIASIHGGNGGIPVDTMAAGSGGHAARYIGNGYASLDSGENAVGVSPYGQNDLKDSIDPVYGKGGLGDGSPPAAGATDGPGDGQHGFVRIMWGANRSFPDNARKIS